MSLFSSAFRAIIGLQIDIQSRILSFDVQSHHYHFSVSVFRVTLITFPISASRAAITSSFGVQSHHSSVSVFRAILVVFSVLTFRAIITTSQFDVQSRILILRSEPLRHSFRRSKPCFASFGVQSHCISFVSTFGATPPFWRSEPLDTPFRTF